MYHETEIANLIMGLISLIIFYFKKKDFPRYNLFFYAYFSIIGSLIFTVVKKAVLPDIFNVLEHLGFTLAGILFAAGSYVYFVKPGTESENLK